MVTRLLVGVAAGLALLASCTGSPDGHGLLDPELVRLDAVAAADDDGGVKCYVKGDPSGNEAGKPLGSKKNPYASLADVENVPGCTHIEVLYSPVPLDGGITLRAGQKIRGTPAADGTLPRITNTMPGRNGGRAIILADRTTVTRLHITNTVRSGIWGRDVDAVDILGNELSGFNTDLAIHPDMLGNFRFYWAGIHLEYTEGGGRRKIAMRDNHLRDARGSGIVVSAIGDADVKLPMSGNTLSRLAKAPRNPDPFPGGAGVFAWLNNLGIGVFAYGSSRVTAHVVATRIEDHGPAPALTGGICSPANATSCLDFDGFDIYAGDSGILDAVIDDYTYTNSPPATGGTFESQAVQAGVDAFAVGASLSLEIRNARLSDPIGGHLALRTYTGMQNASVRYVVTDNVMERHRTGFRAGVSLEHGALPHQGPPSVATRFELVFKNNVVRRFGGAIGDGLHLINVAGEIGDLSVLLQDNQIEGLGSTGGGLRFQDDGTTLTSVIDAGGGALGSTGGNAITGFGASVRAVNYAVSAKHNWWGSVAGPTIVAIGTGSVDFVPFLLVSPFP